MKGDGGGWVFMNEGNVSCAMAQSSNNYRKIWLIGKFFTAFYTRIASWFLSSLSHDGKLG
jgi:lipoate-protein ligase A